MKNFFKVAGLDFCQKMMELCCDGIAVVDQDGKYLWVNQTFIKMFTYKKAEEIIGKPLSLTVHPDDLTKIEELRQRQQNGTLEIKKQAKNNRPIFSEVSIFHVQQNGQTFSVILSRDITERKKIMEELRALSLTDGLTGLYNRRAFTMMASQELKLAKRLGKPMTIFFIDVDGLKIINDGLGHNAGDQALACTASVLRRVFSRETDIIGRLGGDEFVILSTEVSFVDVAIILRRLKEEAENFNLTSGLEFKLSLSVGVAHFDATNPVSLNELFASADAEMYKFKKSKKGQI